MGCIFRFENVFFVPKVDFPVRKCIFSFEKYIFRSENVSFGPKCIFLGAKNTFFSTKMHVSIRKCIFQFENVFFSPKVYFSDRKLWLRILVAPRNTELFSRFGKITRIPVKK